MFIFYLLFGFFVLFFIPLVFHIVVGCFRHFVHLKKAAIVTIMKVQTKT